jgi:hypothetical protein
MENPPVRETLGLGRSLSNQMLIKHQKINEVKT